MNQKFAVRLKQIGYALVSLLASNIVLLILLLLNAMRIRSSLLAAHMGQPGQQISLTLQLSAIYGSFSFLGWLMMGLPIALFVPADSVLRLPVLVRLIVGMVIGPFALFAIFVILSHGQIHAPGTFRNTGFLWVLSVLMSAVTFLLYCVLLGKDRTSAGAHLS
jgi:hypothetical protein